MTSTRIDGQFWIRLCVLCSTTHLEPIDLALALLRAKVDFNISAYSEYSAVLLLLVWFWLCQVRISGLGCRASRSSAFRKLFFLKQTGRGLACHFLTTRQDFAGGLALEGELGQGFGFSQLQATD